MAYYAPPSPQLPPQPPPAAAAGALGVGVGDLPIRALGLVGAGLVVLTAALPWLDGPGLPDGSGLATASRLWAVGGVLSGSLRLAAVLWIMIPIAGCVLWALRFAVRGWSWPASFAVGVVTLGLTVGVVVTVTGVDGAGPAIGIWLGVLGAVVGLVADLLHYVRTPRATSTPPTAPPAGLPAGPPAGPPATPWSAQ